VRRNINSVLTPVHNARYTSHTLLMLSVPPPSYNSACATRLATHRFCTVVQLAADLQIRAIQLVPFFDSIASIHNCIFQSSLSIVNKIYES